ncbi:MAG TPA: GDSL-type esterase/lipase family protein [Rhodanobacteraceae bacterium]
MKPGGRGALGLAAARCLLAACALSLGLVAAQVAFAASPATGQQAVAANNPDYVYAGRVDFSDPAAPRFYWAGNAVTIGFTGRKLAVSLATTSADVYMDVIVNGDGAHPYVIHCRKGRHVYPIRAALASGRHTVEVFRRVDPTWPAVRFEGIRIAAGARVFRPSLPHALRIVFYGDSITSGYGVLSPNRKDEGNPAYMDNYVAYDAVAARALHAAYRSISLSGIGVLKSWFPLTMPQMYDRLAPRDPQSRWNFASWTPDVVVVNLLQNDAWLLPREKHPPSRQRIVAAYAGFVRALRGHYPHAAIICMLGNMDVTAKGSAWPGYVQAAVHELRAAGDARVYALIVPYKQTPGHPDIAEQRTLAAALVGKVKAIEAARR